MYKKNESSCLHVRGDFLIHISVRIVTKIVAIEGFFMEQKNFQFQMPRFREIPNVGLYLEQTVQYINDCIAPLDLAITSSMLSNYVKKGYVDRPVKKQYNAEQIAYLIFMSIVKQTLSMENIAALFQMQKETYSIQEAYNYFCEELEKKLKKLFEGDFTDENPADMTFEKRALTSVVIAISNIIYLNFCFKEIKEDGLSE